LNCKDPERNQILIVCTVYTRLWLMALFQKQCQSMVADILYQAQNM
jgi:hypothetical protein